MNDNKIWERSSVWLERMPVTHEVASSSLVVPELESGGFFYRFLILNDRARIRQFRELRE